MKTPNPVIAQLSELRQLVLEHRRVAGGVLVIAVAALLAWLFVDTSETLNAAQIQDVRIFVQRTHSATVIGKFNEALSDGRLTVNETRAVIEVAKRAEPGYGFLSDQKNSE